MSGIVPARTFQVLDPGRARMDGFCDLSSAQTAAIYNGYVAAVNSVGAAYLCDGTDDAYGLFYDHMALEEYPTTDNLTTYLTGERVNIVTGPFEAVCATFMFTGGTAPAVGALLYDDEAGAISGTTGTNKVGRCVGTESVGGDLTVYRCVFQFPALVA